VEELWSPNLTDCLEKEQAKADALFQRVLHARSAEVFLSQAGPQFDLELLQAEHHL